MSTVHPYLGEFGKNDVRWLQEHGVHLRVRAGDRVSTEGVTPEHVFVVLEGEFRVSSPSINDHDVPRVKAGELLGEMPYINRAPPGASVLAEVGGLLLALRRTDVDARIAEAAAFGIRFRKVLADFADRFPAPGA